MKFDHNQFAVMNRGVITDFYEFGPQLGEGSYGKVFKCYKLSDRAQVRAVKQLVKEHKTHQEREKFVRESNFLKELPHSNVIEIFEMFEDDENFFLVTEYFEGMDLNNRLDYLP